MTQTTNREPVVFNPNEHLMQLKSREGSKDYLPVQWRLVWFRSLCPQGTIETEEMEVNLDREMEEEAYVWNSEKHRSEKVTKKAKGYARFKATITDGKGGKATGTKSESAASFADYIEKAETGAIGRALAALGYGTQFAPELNEEERIVDSPVERSVLTTARPTAAPTPVEPPAPRAEEDAALLARLRYSIAADKWPAFKVMYLSRDISDEKLSHANLLNLTNELEKMLREQRASKPKEGAAR